MLQKVIEAAKEQKKKTVEVERESSKEKSGCELKLPKSELKALQEVE